MAGTIVATASGVILKSGSPVRVYNVSAQSSSDGPATIIFRNGTTSSGTEYNRLGWDADASANEGFGESGKFYPGGLYLELTNVASVSVDCELVAH